LTRPPCLCPELSDEVSFGAAKLAKDATKLACKLWELARAQDENYQESDKKRVGHRPLLKTAMFAAGKSGGDSRSIQARRLAHRSI
jgi:hypothetical protein